MRIKKEKGARAVINRRASMFTVFFTDKNPRDFASAKLSDTKTYARYFHAMLDNGVCIPPSQFEACFISAAHTERDIDKTLSAFGRALESACGGGGV